MQVFLDLYSLGARNEFRTNRFIWFSKSSASCDCYFLHSLKVHRDTRGLEYRLYGPPNILVCLGVIHRILHVVKERSLLLSTVLQVAAYS